MHTRFLLCALFLATLQTNAFADEKARPVFGNEVIGTFTVKDEPLPEAQASDVTCLKPDCAEHFKAAMAQPKGQLSP